MESRESFITAYDRYLFAQGTHYDIYEKLGAHHWRQDGVEGTHFAVWAPNAREVSLLCGRSGWQRGRLPLYRLGDEGVWACFVPEMGEGELYKFAIHGRDGVW